MLLVLFFFQGDKDVFEARVFLHQPDHLLPKEEFLYLAVTPGDDRKIYIDMKGIMVHPTVLIQFFFENKNKLCSLTCGGCFMGFLGPRGIQP